MLLSRRSVKLFCTYLRHNQINEYLVFLAEKFKDFVSVEVIGTSYEKRPLKVIRISTQSNDVKEKRSVFIDGGFHAREWITVSCALYCIHALITYKNSHKNLLDKFDFYILPVVCADGYEFSHTNNRLWRKTRRPVVCAAASGKKSAQIGTDCNRNFDFHWDEGPNSSQKLTTFRGEKPFSEPETLAVKDFLSRLNCTFYLTLHSHAQAISYPWAFTKVLPDRWKELHKVATVGGQAIKKATGTKYRVGNTAKIIKRTVTGSSADYAFGVLNIPFVIVMELSGKDFDPPSHEIKRLVKESWIGIREMLLSI